MRVLTLALLLAILPTVAPSGYASEPITVSGFVGGWNGPGWWTIDIDAEGKMQVKIVRGGGVSRSLAPAERRTLRKLVSALPVDRPKYDFGGHGPVDGTPIFALTVRRNKVVREYYFAARAAGERVPPDLVALQRVWRFLRDRFESDGAEDPGPINEPITPRLWNPGELPNKEMKLTSVERIGHSQLISGVRWT